MKFDLNGKQRTEAYQGTFDVFCAEDMLSVETIKQRNEQFKAARSFQVGQTVSFFNSRMGQKIIGEVIKVNTKNIKVKTQDGNWNVTASLLSAA